VSIIIVNKHVMTFSGFNFPFSLALWHMFLGTVTSRAAMKAMGMPDTLREHATPALYFQVGMIGAATLVTGNAALRMLTVPTVQMLKVCWGFGWLSPVLSHSRRLCKSAHHSDLLQVQANV
jgi:hypothetical protein